MAPLSAVDHDAMWPAYLGCLTVLSKEWSDAAVASRQSVEASLVEGLNGLEWKASPTVSGGSRGQGFTPPPPQGLPRKVVTCCLTNET